MKDSYYILFHIALLPEGFLFCLPLSDYIIARYSVLVKHLFNFLKCFFHESLAELLAGLSPFEVI